MESQTITMLFPVLIVAFIIWVVHRNRKLKRAHEAAIRRDRIRNEELAELFDGKNPSTDIEARSFYMRWMMYDLTDEELAEKWAEEHRSPEERAAERRERIRAEIAELRRSSPASGSYRKCRESALGRSDAGFDDLDSDFSDSDYDDSDLRELDPDDSDLRDLDLDDPDLREKLDEDDWGREDAVMRAQSSLRIMREEDQNYALDAIEANVLNLDHEPDEEELAAIADSAADAYDMSEDYRDY